MKPEGDVICREVGIRDELHPESRIGFAEEPLADCCLRSRPPWSFPDAAPSSSLQTVVPAPISAAPLGAC